MPTKPTDFVQARWMKWRRSTYGLPVFPVRVRLCAQQRQKPSALMYYLTVGNVSFYVRYFLLSSLLGEAVLRTSFPTTIPQSRFASRWDCRLTLDFILRNSTRLPPFATLLALRHRLRSVRPKSSPILLEDLVYPWENPSRRSRWLRAPLSRIISAQRDGGNSRGAWGFGNSTAD